VIRRRRSVSVSFAGFRFPPDVILLAVRWYLRYGLSYRDVEELLAERGIDVDHVTIYRWVQRFTPLMIEEARREITGHTASEAARRVDDEGALLVDIRDVRELQREGVAVGAHHAPRGMLEFWVDPESPYHKPVFAEDREFIFY
jgi:hypothetical protein